MICEVLNKHPQNKKHFIFCQVDLTSCHLSNDLKRGRRRGWQVNLISATSQVVKVHLFTCQVPLVLKRKCRTLGNFAHKLSVKVMFLEWFWDVLHHERPHCNLPGTWQCCCGVGGFSATICRQYVRWDMPTIYRLYVKWDMGSDRGFVCRKFLWAYSFWGRWCVSQWKYASRYGRDQHVGCVTCESRNHTTHEWNVLQVEWSKF